jgi:predicted Zn-dependent protease
MPAAAEIFTQRSWRKIEAPEIHRLRAAEGWLELGDWRSANDELQEMPAWTRGHPDVLDLRFEICVAAGMYQDALAVADALVRGFSKRVQSWINRANALHLLGRHDEAFRLLKPLANRYPKNAAIAYNLACYAARMGRYSDARWWILEAIQLGENRALVAKALEDRDLKGIW